MSIFGVVLRLRAADRCRSHRAILGAGLVDEMEIHLVPTLLGAGERLFEGARDLGSLQLVRTVAAPDVTHFKFVRR
jgi:dihydrofolate reductase